LVAIGVHEGRLKATIFRSLEVLGILALWERSAKGVPVLAYHGVTLGKDEGALGNRRRLHVPARRFEEHLRFLTSRWHPIRLSELRAHLVDGRTIPKRSVVITFDDGYRNVLSVALPILRRFSVPATLFVLTAERPSRLWMDRLESALEKTELKEFHWDGAHIPLDSAKARARAVATLAAPLQSLGPERESKLQEILQGLQVVVSPPDDDRDLLTWEEVRTVRGAGLEIGSHADAHEPLTSAPPEAVHERLLQSRTRLEAELGSGPYPLAYPYGSWTPAVRASAESAGFSCALTTDAGLNRPDTDPFLLRRHLVGADDDRPRLRASLSGLRSALGRAS
jgi:peptidoglycan/xylan/chitin deacetylase (PgdA/CDA1 family)